jgi:hypothetical protein
MVELVRRLRPSRSGSPAGITSQGLSAVLQRTLGLLKAAASYFRFCRCCSSEAHVARPL